MLWNSCCSRRIDSAGKCFCNFCYPFRFWNVLHSFGISLIFTSQTFHKITSKLTSKEKCTKFCQKFYELLQPCLSSYLFLFSVFVDIVFLWLLFVGNFPFSTSAFQSIFSRLDVRYYCILGHNPANVCSVLVHLAQWHNHYQCCSRDLSETSVLA